MAITHSSEQRALRLVEPQADPVPALRGENWPIDLNRTPYRPGELPESVAIEVEREIALHAREHAQAAGLPIALWSRIAIEYSRVSASLQRLDVDIRLRRASGQGDIVSGLSPLERYAAALLSARGSQERSARESIELLIPSEMLLAWRHAANRSGENLVNWAASALGEGKSEAVLFEARAAAAGETLSAWCYAAFLA